MIPKSTDPAHIRENLDLFERALDDEDLARLDRIDRDRSVYTLPSTDWTDDVFGVSK